MDSSSHCAELAASERFKFGENWARFLSVLDEERILQAEASLRRILGVETLNGRRFLDVGSGSGLFSLAARRLGAGVLSVDYDSESVSCTRELQRRYFAGDIEWTVEAGSVLDKAYLDSLGEYDIVYSWGVLHQTGEMWRALANVAPLVAHAGLLFVAMYNDQGGASRRWWHIKRIYNRLPRSFRPLFTAAVMIPRELLFLVVQLFRGHPQAYFKNIANYAQTSQRGLNYWRDIVDWVGGFPFEVAKPEQVFRFYRDRGFGLSELTTMTGGVGCNEFVFVRQACPEADDCRRPS